MKRTPLIPLLVLFALALLFMHGARSEDAVIVCTPPTLNTDGTPALNPAIRLYGAISNTVRQTAQPGQPCRFTESNLTPGPHSWYVTAVTATGESVPSNPVGKTVEITPPPPPPPPPPPVLSTTSTVVYAITAGNDRLAFLIVGSVPLGTPCVAAQEANGFNVVPRSAVTFDGPAKPSAVLGRCALQ
jgi:hypothetical protein